MINYLPSRVIIQLLRLIVLGRRRCCWSVPLSRFALIAFLFSRAGIFSFMKPIAFEIWMYVIMAYISVGTSLFVISRFSPYEWRVDVSSNSASGGKSAVGSRCMALDYGSSRIGTMEINYAIWAN